MLLSYLKLSLRLLVRNPFFAFINVLGLSVGFASFFILWQYSTSELKSDQHHKDFERIVKVGATLDFTDDGKSRGHVASGAIVAYQVAMLANDFPYIQSYTRFLQQPLFDDGDTQFVGHSNKVMISVEREDRSKELFEETRMIYADPNLFEFFNIPLLLGAKERVLQKSRSVVLSKTVATKYFGKSDPEGRIIMVNDNVLLTVTGVYEDLPRNTHLAFDLVVSNVGLESVWQNYPYLFVSNYLKIDEVAHLDDLEEKINKSQEKYWERHSKDFPNWKFRMTLQPLSEIVFSLPDAYIYFQPKSKTVLILLKVVSVLILLMAWINYINLSVSRMIKRMKEIATRKMSGAIATDLVTQFLSESIVLNILAVSIAFTIMQLVRIPMVAFFNIHIPEFTSISIRTWYIFIGTIVAGIGITGFYPALMSISYNPRSLLMISRKAPKRRLLQTILTTSQYSIGLILILWAFTVYLQLNYILHKNVGIEREQILIVDAPPIKSPTYRTDFNYFVNEIRTVPNVYKATYSMHVVGDEDVKYVFMRGKNQSSSMNIAMDSNGGVDQTFIPFYGIQMIAGRNFIGGDRSDAIILSRHGTERLGYARPEDAVGELVNDGTKVIVGVMEDYRFSSLVNPIEPSTYASVGRGICLVYDDRNDSTHVNPEKISLKVNAAGFEQTIEDIKEKFSASFPGNIFKWYFLDDHINRAYENEKINRNQIALFTLLAIGISCLGLLGMVTTLAEDKTKEIGIRKVLGATVRQIGGRLLSIIFRQIVIAIFIALPISYYLANQYLDRYLERINLQWWHFVLPILILIVILFTTVASVLWKAAKSNPVEALKYE